MMPTFVHRPEKLCYSLIFMDRIEQHIISVGSNLREALTRMNSLKGGSMTLFVANNDGKIEGTLTDGDIRRGLLAGASLATDVGEVMHREFLFLEEGEDSLVVTDRARRRGVSLLPRLDSAGRLAGIADLRSMRSVLPLDAVLMAGGKGMRLRPLTLTTPKPLLPVGGKPIIDHNVELLRRFGIDNIFATVNYLHEMIEEHFSMSGGDGVQPVRCVPEPCALGTFGSLTLVEGLRHDNLVVMNADLFTDIDFEAMYRRHTESGASLTIAAVPYTVSVPYAILHTAGADSIDAIEEKPTYNYFANAGVYIMRREMIGSMKKAERLDAPDFIELLLRRGDKVAYFPIEGMWTDIGSPDDYRCVCELLARKS